MDMNMLEQDWDTADPYVDDGAIDWRGYPAADGLKFPDRRFGLYEESSAGSADSHLGFAVDSIALEDDPE